MAIVDDVVARGEVFIPVALDATAPGRAAVSPPTACDLLLAKHGHAELGQDHTGMHAFGKQGRALALSERIDSRELQTVLTEDLPLAPINPYGASKMMSERMIMDLAAASDLNYVILRYFNVAGANPDGLLGQATPEATHLIKVACECVTGQRDGMSVFGTDYGTRDGTCVRDYIHVEDLAKAHVMALDYMAGGGESKVLNCGYGRGFTVREVIDVVKQQSGVDFPVAETERRAGDPEALMADNSRIKAVLGWTPDYDDLQTIVKTALAWEAIWQQRKASTQ